MLLELFSGTKSISKVYNGDVISLDIIAKSKPDICINILNWDYKNEKLLKNKKIDIIWASPPCTEYSKAKSRGNRNITLANTIVKTTIDIIDYFNPRVWFIENPQTGLLKNQSFMDKFHYVDVDYCKYGFPYRKRTRLWTNMEGLALNPLCSKDNPCNYLIKGESGRFRHLINTCNGRKAYNSEVNTKKITNSLAKAVIPPDLCKVIIEYMLKI